MKKKITTVAPGAAAAAAAQPADGPCPCHDRQRRTCLLVERENGQVKYIPLDVVEGLRVQTTSSISFDHRYQPMINYPMAKAAQLYLRYAQDIGATEEALKQLGRFITITNEEQIMATKKTPVAATTKKTKTATTKKTKTATTKKTKTATTTISAAQMFKDLIMEGGMTDAKIFAKVQAKFGLEDKKRNYVSWYRNDLRKAGKNPPDALVA